MRVLQVLALVTVLVSPLDAAPLVLTVEPVGPPTPAATPVPPRRDPFAGISPTARKQLRRSYMDMWEGTRQLTEARVQDAVRVGFLRGLMHASAGRIRTREDAVQAFFPGGHEFEEDLDRDLRERVGAWAARELMPVIPPVASEARSKDFERRWRRAERSSAPPPGRHLILEVDPAGP